MLVFILGIVVGASVVLLKDKILDAIKKLNPFSVSDVPDVKVEEVKKDDVEPPKV